MTINNWMFDSSKIVCNLGGENISHINNVAINCIASATDPLNESMIFATQKKWKEEYRNKLDKIKNSFIILEEGIARDDCYILQNNHVVVVKNARLYFAKALDMILKEVSAKREYMSKENNVVIGENVKIGRECNIEPFVFIDHDVEIGDNVTIKCGAKIRSNVQICNNAVIGENSVIGAQGFGIETDKNGNNIRIPHIGGVVIGENVEIGALTSIVAGTINPTVVEKNCMIDDLNHIAHNCYLGQGTLTTGCAELGGSAKIGKNGYIAPNVTIRNGISLGENCFVGQASSVQKSFGDNVNLVGSPAKIFNKK